MERFIFFKNTKNVIHLSLLSEQNQLPIQFKH